MNDKIQINSTNALGRLVRLWTFGSMEHRTYVSLSVKSNRHPHLGQILATGECKFKRPSIKRKLDKTTGNLQTQVSALPVVRLVARFSLTNKTTMVAAAAAVSHMSALPLLA